MMMDSPDNGESSKRIEKEITKKAEELKRRRLERNEEEQAIFKAEHALGKLAL